MRHPSEIRRRAACAAAAIMLAAAGRTAAATLEVNASGGTPYQTIQSAINAAVPGTDSVFVHCGVYHENLLMRDRVSVVGEGPHCVTIDGGASGSVVSMTNIGSTTTLRGFTITNGRSALGGGISLIASSPVVTRNVITGNSAVLSGSYTGYGGGIHISSSISLTSDIEPLAAAAPLIAGNVIRGNTAEAFGGGIEISSDAGSRIVNNIIVGNTAAEGGGAIDIFQSFPTIANNTIARNCIQTAAAPCAQGGGGILLTLSGVLDIANNVIAWNEAASGGGGVDQASSTVTYRNNDAYQNLPANYAGVANPTGTNGNVSVPPLFEDEPAGNYGLRSDSTLVDGAADQLAPADDLRGFARPVDGDADATPHADIGALENDGITRLVLASAGGVAWDPTFRLGAVYNLYRGDVLTLRQTGIYNQDPALVPGATRQCGLPSAAAADADVPAAGSSFFYLAVVDHVVEGTLGRTSSGSERPFSPGNRCP